MRRRKLLGSLVVLAVVTTVTSCAALNVNAVPLPGTSYTGGYDITAEFSNVLNLPDRAKVVMDGTNVGVVQKVKLTSDRVDVTARIGPDVRVPSNVHAVLQQATVLGDIYVALERQPDTTAPPIPSGGRIPLAQTTSPPQLEDTIASMANFIGSGTIQRMQDSLIEINRVTPAKSEVKRVVGQVTTDLVQLSDNIDTVDTLITSFQQSTAVAANWAPQMAQWFSDRGIAGLERNNETVNILATLLPSLGSIYNYGYWLVPLLGVLADGFGAAQGTKQALEHEYPLYRRFINDFFMPQDKYPAINIKSILGPDGRELAGNTEQVLRMLGAIP